MRAKALTLLVIFMSFIVLPTIVNSISNKMNITIDASFAEEEEESHKNQSEVKKDFIAERNTLHVDFLLENNDCNSIEFQLRHDNATSEIFLPPPEQRLV